MWDKGVHFTIQRILLSAAALCCLAPVVYLLYCSLRSFGGFSLEQYEEILFNTKEFFTWFWNSFGFSLLILLLGVPVSILAAYGFSQYDFRGKNGVFFLYMLLMLLPFQATVVAQYLTLRALKLLDSWSAVVLPCAYGAFGPFLLTQFMKGIDKEILEAARLDGVSLAQMMRHIILPLCKPAVISLVILQLISSWSMVDQPLLFLRSEYLLPLSLKLGNYTFGASVSTAGVIYAVLPLLAYLYCQDALEKGISLSSIK